MTRNIELFNEIVGLIFDQLYQEFPVPIDIDMGAIAEAMGVDVVHGQSYDGSRIVKEFGNLEGDRNFFRFTVEALIWLRAEGFIDARGEIADVDVRLTAKALTALAAPVAIGGSLGQKLNSAVKDAGTEVGRSVISETVGQIIGAAVKSMTS